MYDRIKKFTPQINTVFGALFVREQHGDAADRQLPPSDIRQLILSLRVAMLSEMMKSFRGTLLIRRQRLRDEDPS
jgi:hypothetical protein